MSHRLVTCFIISVLCYACNTSPKKSRLRQAMATTDSQISDTAKIERPINKSARTFPKNSKPVFGYRFVISGDFNGDGKKEKLIEHFYSGLNHKETNKFYDSLGYDDQVAMAVEKDPYSFIACNNHLIDTLHISSGGQLLGLSYLKNEGDLNGDGTDEISYVVDWADWSNLNTWHIMTFKNKRWKELYSFPIWDWQLPDLPQTVNQYGLFGLDSKIIIYKKKTQ